MQGNSDANSFNSAVLDNPEDAMIVHRAVICAVIHSCLNKHGYHLSKQARFDVEDDVVSIVLKEAFAAWQSRSFKWNNFFSWLYGVTVNQIHLSQRRTNSPSEKVVRAMSNIDLLADALEVRRGQASESHQNNVRIIVEDVLSKSPSDAQAIIVAWIESVEATGFPSIPKLAKDFGWTEATCRAIVNKFKDMVRRGLANDGGAAVNSRKEW
jgi:DNA-directed RNA polymerase specialized sigma24 family protein